MSAKVINKDINHAIFRFKNFPTEVKYIKLKHSRFLYKAIHHRKNLQKMSDKFNRMNIYQLLNPK